MNQRARFISKRYSLENSIKQLKHCLARAIREIKHSACGLDTNGHSAARLVLYFTYIYTPCSTRGNALTNTCNTLRGRHQSLELWYITDIPQLQGYIPQLPYTACLALMRLRSV